MKAFFLIAAILPYLFVFLATLSHPSDPDLGWHLKYGEYFFKNLDVLRDNTFSTMMADYHWANTSWGTDVIGYGVFKLGGFLGLALASSVIVTATFFFFAKAANLSFFEQAFVFPILVFFLNPINSVSFRGQQISLLLTGIMFFLLNLATHNKKFAYLLILLFLLWVNLHGQFFLGLALFGLWISIRLMIIYATSEKEKLIKTLTEFKSWFIIITLSFIATLFNPSGIKIYSDDLIRHFGDPNLIYVAEYGAVLDQSQLFKNLVLVLVLMFFGIMSHFLKDSWKKYMPQIMLSIVLFGITLFVRRYAWTFLYTAMPVIAPIFGLVKPPSKKWSTFVPIVILLPLILFVIIDKQSVGLLNMNWDTYCNQPILCSPKSLKYLEENRDKLSINKNPSKLLSVYDFGGYMIWNSPIKPAIDGRMHLWRDDNGYSAFDEYYALEQGWKDVNKSRFDVVYMSRKKPLYQEMVKLAQKGEWRALYTDKRAGIFVRKNK